MICIIHLQLPEHGTLGHRLCNGINRRSYCLRGGKPCGRIAVLGGIDVDLLIRQSPAQVTERCVAML